MLRSRLRVLLVSTALAITAGLVYGLLPLVPFGDDVATFLPSAPVASAQPYCGQNPACGGDPTVTSALDVHHRVHPGGLSDDPVQLDDDELVTITVYWSLLNVGGQCACTNEISQSVTIQPTLSGSTWSGTCTGCNAGGPIYDVVICDINSDNCMSLDNDYRLNVDIDELNGNPAGFCSLNMRHINRVMYTITNISNGDDYDGTHCVVGSAVSPTTSSFSTTDFGSFECNFNCEAGPSLTVTFN